MQPLLLEGNQFELVLGAQEFLQEVTDLPLGEIQLVLQTVCLVSPYYVNLLLHGLALLLGVCEQLFVCPQLRLDILQKVFARTDSQTEVVNVQLFQVLHFRIQ